MVFGWAMSGQCIGMALLKDGWETDYYGRPPVFSMGCVGRLASVQPLADGRSNILLQGLERFEIEREWYDNPYREATILSRSGHRGVAGSTVRGACSLS
jgi:Lon protease-like protein